MKFMLQSLINDKWTDILTEPVGLLTLHYLTPSKLETTQRWVNVDTGEVLKEMPKGAMVVDTRDLETVADPQLD